jgi:hypothetical protein
MGKSIGNIKLKQHVTNRIVDFICEKNDRLCKGKNVDKVNAMLRMSYNYYKLLEYCGLTDNEINCAYNEIGYKIERVDSEPLPIPVVQEIEQEVKYPPLRGVILQKIVQWNTYSDGTIYCQSRNFDGHHYAEVTAKEGAPPYTFTWSLINEIAQYQEPECQLTNAEITTLNYTQTDSNVIGFGMVSDYNVRSKYESTTWGGGYYKLQCVITDSIGQTVTLVIAIYRKSLYE